MSGVADPKTIDLVTYQEETDEIKLIMIETRPWGSDGDLILDLQEKFQTYLDFIESGQLVKRFPEAARKRVCIRLDCIHPVGPIEQKFLAMVRQEWLATIGVRLEVGAISDDGD